MQYRKICLNGLAVFGLVSLVFVVYHINDGVVGTFNNIPHRNLLSAPTSPLSSSLSSSSSESLKSPPSSKLSRTSTSLKSGGETQKIIEPNQPSSSSPSSSSSGPSKRQLLLVTKGRSGSSFTSALIQNDGQVFYTFEPLFILQRLAKEGQATAEALKQKAYAVLRAFLKCDFSEVSGQDLDNFQIRLSSPLASHFLQCIRSKKIGPQHLDCLFDMMRDCKKKTVTFAKVIRFPMIWAEPALQQLPNLKILYLIRDPRAVLHSQARVFRTFKWPADVESASKGHCESLEDDIAEIERLQVQYPGRIHVIKYERGATESMTYARDIYKFAGLNFTQETTTYMESLKDLNNPAAKKNAYSLYRSNGTQTMNSWRYRAGYNAIKVVDGICAKIYHKMGYEPVTSQKDLESNRQLVDLDVSINKMAAT